MKRELAKHEQSAIRNLAADFCRRIDTKGPYEDGLITGSADGYRAGYTACAESSVPLELFREVVDELKKTAGELFNVKSDAVESTGTPVMEADKIARRNPAYVSARAALDKAKSYLP